MKLASVINVLVFGGIIRRDFAHLGTLSKNYNCNDENRFLSK